MPSVTELPAKLAVNGRTQISMTFRDDEFDAAEFPCQKTAQKSYPSRFIFTGKNFYTELEFKETEGRCSSRPML